MWTVEEADQIVTTSVGVFIGCRFEGYPITHGRFHLSLLNNLDRLLVVAERMKDSGNNF